VVVSTFISILDRAPLSSVRAACFCFLSASASCVCVKKKKYAPRKKARQAGGRKSGGIPKGGFVLKAPQEILCEIASKRPRG